MSGSAGGMSTGKNRSHDRASDQHRSAARSGRRLGRTIATLAVTQLIGWGTTFYLPAVLSGSMSRASGVPVQWVYGGVSLMLMVSAGIAPAAGRLLERRGPRNAMVGGSLGLAAGLTILAFADHPVGFACAWVVIGAVTPFSLTQASSTAIVQAAPAGEARRGLTVLLLFSGLASTASWPVLIWLDGAIGLRASLLVYAAIHCLVCAPLHALVLPRGRRLAEPSRPSATLLATSGSAPPRPVDPVPGAFWLSATAFSFAGVISWGLPLHAVALLESYGHPPGVAVAVGIMLGPGQLVARLLEIFGGHKLDILTIGVAAAALMPVAILALALDGSSLAGALVFTLGYGLSAGTLSIVRAVAPIRLFGQAGYAVVVGRLLVPQNIAFASAPLLFAAIREAGGSGALLGFTLVAALASLAGFVLLRVRAGAPPRP